MMKYYYLLITFLFSIEMTSQMLENDNFEDYESGILNGQGGWSREGGDDSEVIVGSIIGNNGKSLQFNRSQTTDEMWVFKFNNLATPWLDRDAGNDVYVAEFDFFTGENPIGIGESGVQIYADNYNYIAGIYFDYTTKMFVGSTYPAYESEVAYYDLDEVAFPDNSWVNIKIFYDSISGNVTWQINNSTAVNVINSYSDLNPVEFDFFTFGEKNTSVDNYKSIATKQPNLDVVSNNPKDLFKIKIYPNPSSDLINLKSNIKIINTQLFDTTGKEYKSLYKQNNMIDISQLAKGVYIIKVVLENGKIHAQKIIKK